MSLNRWFIFLFIGCMVAQAAVAQDKSASANQSNSGVVMGILYSADPLVLVRVDGGQNTVVIALQDVELPDRDTSDLAASISKLCSLICHKRISWDVFSQTGQAEYRAYAYLGDMWLNDHVVRLGLAHATDHPVHPALRE